MIPDQQRTFFQINWIFADQINTNANFEQDLIDLPKTGIPMGLREAILEDVKKQGIEQGLEQGIEQGLEQGIEIGEAKREAELLQNAVPELMQEGFSAERIATILNLPLERVQAVIERVSSIELEQKTAVSTPAAASPTPSEDPNAH